MNFIKYSIFTVFLTLFIFNVKAQQDLTLMNLTNIQQIQYVNPAFRPQARLNIGIPGVSSLYFNHYNTVFTPKDLFEVNGNQTTLRVDHLRTMWKKRNDISFSSKVDLINFGFLYKDKNYISFNITENAFARLTLPGDLLRFPLTGNANFSQLNDGTLDFSNFGLELNHYREYALGLQRQLSDKWSVGAKAKYLYGMENIHTKKSDIKWKTDPNTYDWTISGQYDVNTSGIYTLTDSIDDNNDIENNDFKSYLMKRKNRGFAVDLGATYELNEKLTVAASIMDLGFIRWKNDTKNVVTDNGEFVFRGIDFTNAVMAADSVRQDSIDALVSRTEDDFKNSFNATSNTKAYTTSLMTRFYLTGSYKLFDIGKYRGKISGLFHGELFRGRLRPSYSVAYTQDLGRILQLTASYSITHRDYQNIGLGMSLNLGSFQIYMVTDNVLAGRLAEMKTGSSSFKYPYSAKNMHVRAGINLTFGRKNNDKDGDGIKDKKDNCPEVAGLEIFNGCPDTDNDSIPDPVDACPQVAGIPAFKGCPDTDGDGIKDSEDKCPTEKGKKETNGCPDKDADGIIDAEDKCPDVAGIKAFEGCPDTDEDGIPDSEDKCPTEVGSKEMEGCPDTDADGLPDHIDACPMEAGDMENNGCPWGDRDNDGVKDNKDKCPNTPGLIENQGCPNEDSDNDGVPNKTDKCPNTPGPASNNGCPELKKEEQEVLNTAFDNLEFESGRAIIKDESYPSLQALAELLQKKPTWKLRISGHTDSDGSASTNLRLSKERAQAVANYLTAKGISADRLIVEGFGETQPIADNKTKEGKQKNRRVEMKVIFD